ncbi:MAG: hypothetical protein GWM88_01255 [Pseudomonadales bacterium]|nr:hypothetical protein [Pseudomonadales bacterium]NIX06716.1 hypothetical protein [Pseudomonadales bacterium]
MKKLIAPAVAGTLLLGAAMSASAPAEAAEFSGNIAYTTDYRFRGISQGDRSQAVQGGFDIELESGLYFGTWASNVTFSGAAIEVDYYAGFAGSFSEDVDYDLGFLWYNYPEDDADPDLDYYELYGSIGAFGGTFGVAFSPDYFAETGDFWYLYGDYSFGVAENFSIDLHVGFNLFEDDEAFADFGLDGGDNYIDYSVGVSTSALGLDFGLSFVGTDLKKSECFGGTKLCDDTVVLSVSKSL